MTDWVTGVVGLHNGKKLNSFVFNINVPVEEVVVILINAYTGKRGGTACIKIVIILICSSHPF